MKINRMKDNIAKTIFIDVEIYMGRNPQCSAVLNCIVLLDKANEDTKITNPNNRRKSR